MRLREGKGIPGRKVAKQRHRGENENELVKWREMKYQSFQGKPSVLS